jgi:hypothetical protein
MNKFLKPAIFLAIAATVVGIMYWMSLPTNPPPPPQQPLKPQSFAQLQNQCNDIGQNLWNRTNYADLKSKIETFSTGTNKTIDASQAEILKTSLELQYAESMVKSYDNWIKSKGTINIDDVYNVMKKQSTVSGCSAVLSRPIEVVTKFKNALTIPNTVNVLLSSTYSEPALISIENQLREIAGITEFNQFQNLNSINDSAVNKIIMFKQIAPKFEANFKIALNQQDWKTYMNLFCPNKKYSVGKYQVYKNRLDSLNLLYKTCD